MAEETRRTLLNEIRIIRETFTISACLTPEWPVYQSYERGRQTSPSRGPKEDIVTRNKPFQRAKNRHSRTKKAIPAGQNRHSHTKQALSEGQNHTSTNETSSPTKATRQHISPVVDHSIHATSCADSQNKPFPWANSRELPPHPIKHISAKHSRQHR